MGGKFLELLFELHTTIKMDKRITRGTPW